MIHNLRLFGGLVPLPSTDPTHPVVLVDFPQRELFDSLWGNRVKGEQKDRYWEILRARAGGAPLSEAGKLADVSKERVRQIETKFLRLMQRHHAKITTS